MADVILYHYDPTLPTHADWVRYHLGDTDANKPEIDDREIQALLDEEDEPVDDPVTGAEVTNAQWRAYRKLVASRGAEAIAAKHAKDADISFENQRVSMSSKFAQYSKLAIRLKSEALTSVPLRAIRW